LGPAALLGAGAAACWGLLLPLRPLARCYPRLRAHCPHTATSKPPKVEPVYETLPGWKADISKARTWQDLPAAARSYVERCEQLLGVPIKWIGVGPGRDAIVVKPQ
jgi:adenylosuccinate synthase